MLSIMARVSHPKRN